MTPRSESKSKGGGALTGTGSLVRFMLRRDRVKLTSWLVGLAAFWLYYTRIVPIAYPSQSDLQAIAGMMGGPAGRMWTGPTYFLENMTHATFIPAAYGVYYLLLVAMMSMLLIIRHTRVEEQTGRAELVRASVVGRHAPLAAAMITAVIANGILALLVAAMMIADPLFATEGSLVFAAGSFATGLAFAGFTTIIVQVTEYSRTATGLALGLGLGLSFLIKAFGDMGDEHGTLLSWFSPFAWPQQSAPFVLDRWWPLLLSLAFTFATTAIGFVLSTRRDVGAGLVPARAGRANGARSLGSPFGLAWRLERRTITWWSIGMGFLGFAMGTFADTMVPGEMPDTLAQVLGTADAAQGGYVAYMGVFMATIVAVYAVLTMQGLRAEETGGRGEPVLATAVSRWSWLGANLAVGAVGSLIIMAATGAGTGLGMASVTNDNTWIWDVTAVHLNHLPGVLVVLGVSGLLFGLAPRLMGLSWVLVAYGFVAGTFGPLMGLEDWVLKLSPFAHTARMPVEEFLIAPFVMLMLVAVGAALLGLIGFRRRDISAT